MRPPLRLASIVAMTLAAHLLAAAGSRAGVVLDQQFNPASYPTSSEVSAGFGANQNLGQTFTVGLNGTLSEVDVSVERFTGMPTTGTLLLQIRALAATGTPTDDPTFLLQASQPETALPVAGNYGFVKFDVSAAGLQVVKGEQLAIVLLAPTFLNAVSWIGDLGDTYPNGAAYEEQQPNHGWGTLLGARTSDLGFQTFVATAVPEPSALTLATLAFGGLGIARLRTGRRR